MALPDNNAEPTDSTGPARDLADRPGSGRQAPRNSEPEQGDTTAATRPTLVLTGFMGTGKSTVGRLLAERLGATFIDTDRVLIERHGPIEDLFASHGEAHFRDLERHLATELSDVTGAVIATGGRMLLDQKARHAFDRRCTTICLTAEASTILARVTNDDSGINRPLLAGDDPLQRIIDLLEQRHPLYRTFPQVNTDGRPSSDVVDEIIERFANQER